MMPRTRGKARRQRPPEVVAQAGQGPGSVPGRVLLAGCGDLGRRVASRLSDRGSQVHATSRNPDRLPEFVRAIGVDWTADRPPALPDDLNACLVALAPDVRSEQCYRELYLGGLARLLSALAGRTAPDFRLLFVSSTAVYGQDRGEWVDETAATRPSAFNGRILLKAESLLRESLEQSVSVRLSGLYGPGREWLLRRVRQGATCENRYTNRIHIEDATRLICHLLTLQHVAPIYLGSDNQPAMQCEVMGWLAARLAVAPPRGPAGEDAPSGKRCNNKRIRATGFRFRYPDYRDGYAEILASLESEKGQPDESN